MKKRVEETSIMYAGKNGRLIGLVTSCTGTAFKALLKKGWKGRDDENT